MGLGLNGKYTFESFVIGPSNRFAHAARAAAWAKRLDGPITKLSKVYLPLRPKPIGGLEDGAGLGSLVSSLELGPATKGVVSVSYTHLRAHETKANLVCRLLLEKKKKKKTHTQKR